MRPQKTKSLAKNSVFYLIYNVLNVLFPFITGVYVARVLLPDVIGQVAYAQNIASYFVILAFLGIPTYGLREVARARNNKEELNKVYSELVIINLISTFAFLSVYIALILSVPEFRSNKFLYLITGSAIALNALNNSWLYEGLEEFTYISLRNVAFKVFSFVLLVLFVKSSDDYLIYAAITVIGTAGNYILNVLHARRFT
ncbi:MAG: oligosaccharide flippase family protein, partial [Bacilli bacterium]|nr:oligosaccharide flippase family protein [Bacilli bacterium]